MEQLRPWEAALSTVGLGLKEMIAGAIGAFVSLNFFNGLRPWEKWTTFFGGWALAAWGSGPITAIFELRAGISTGVALLLGLFGMSLAAKIISTVRDTDWVGFTKTIVKTFRGGGGGDEESK